MNRRRFCRNIAAVALPLSAPQLFARDENSVSVRYPSEPIADVHMHLLGSNPANGCFLSKRFQKSFALKFSRLFVNFGSGATPEEQDRAYVNRLMNMIAELPDSWRGVLLAMDGIYDSSGHLDLVETLFLIPNDYILSVASKNEKLVPGASINPYRKDALYELERVASLGAVVVKWIPNTMGIDPSEKRIVPFYRRLNELEMTLLTHTGTEYAVGGVVDQKLGNPRLLQLPLEEGVTVIAAHCASGGGDSNGPYFRQFLQMLDENPNLYGDISGLSLMHKSSSLRHLIRNPHYFDRLCYGSDFPLYYTPATSPFYFLGLISVSKAMKLQRIENDLLRDVSTLMELNAPQPFFGRGFEVVKKLKTAGS